jgi:GYF domain 2
MLTVGSNRGLFPEVQLRGFIANGSVRAGTLVWTEGMAGWQRAGGQNGRDGSTGGGSLSIDIEILDFVGGGCYCFSSARFSSFRCRGSLSAI